MAVFRKRLLFWIIRAYLRKWGKIFIFSFLVGLAVFFILIYLIQNFSYLLPSRKEKIGIVGAYRLNNLPSEIVDKISRGLTKVSEEGKILPDVASSWEIKENGKKYIFHLRDDLFFINGEKVTSDTISYDFKDVEVSRPDKSTIVFTLDKPYAPFLVTTSRPIFLDGYKGIGNYALSNIKLNGTFLSSLALNSKTNEKKNETYTFYPNQDSLKTAFMLGKSTKIIGVNSLSFLDTKLDNHLNVSIKRLTNYSQLVTIFYNTNDSILSDSKVRRALTYALPQKFAEGERSILPYSPISIFYNHDIATRNQDIAHASLLIDSAMEAASQSAKPKLTMKVLNKYLPVAEKISPEWKKIGLSIKIEPVDTVPSNFQIYLGDFTVPKDPDQYTLWHSNQAYNITNYRNLRIDKLLEDGRTKTSLNERKKIYDDFQKYLLDDAPASFLYFPYSYTITRK